MVYCRFLSKNDNILIYAIGGVCSDITGRMELNSKECYYKITKQPVKGHLHEYFIDKMLRKYQKQFDKGIVPEKMSYEIG